MTDHDDKEETPNKDHSAVSFEFWEDLYKKENRTYSQEFWEVD